MTNFVAPRLYKSQKMETTTEIIKGNPQGYEKIDISLHPMKFTDVVYIMGLYIKIFSTKPMTYRGFTLMQEN